MRIKSIRCSGFRGVRGTIEVQVPPGFLVITGRNGSGKSTLCDAVEFALTGRLRRQEGETERQEEMQDYVWWRGGGQSADRSVSVTFIDEEGRESTIRRTPQGVDTQFASEAEVHKLLAGTHLAPDNAIDRLLQTAIIRDEEITRLSVDLPETQRFQFVRAAVGEADLSSYTNPLETVCNELKGKADQADKEYERKRESIGRLVEDITEKQADVSKEAEVSAARDVLLAEIDDTSESATVLERARTRLVDLRDELGQLRQLHTKLEELEKEKRSFESREFIDRATELEKQRERIAADLVTARLDREAADTRASEFDARKSDTFAWAELLRYGHEVGLREGDCPLCGSSVSEADFEKHIEEARQQILEADREASQASEAREKAAAHEHELEQQLEAVSEEFEEIQRRRATVSAQHEELQSAFEALSVSAQSPREVDLIIEERRAIARKIERAILTIESSASAEELEELQSELQQARSDAETVQLQAAQVKAQWEVAKQALDSLRRIEGEIIEERLAALGPLLEEIYLRLRPHLDWTQIRYHIRGDVRRFLSLKVGEELNPRFMFSSGQRRAIGIAFLLAAHLSTEWNNLRTIVLDDPVQHIDDFRALHLVELFSALRAADWQVVCTAEDSELAELVVRRLRGLRDQPGAMLKLKYEPGVGTQVDDLRIFHPIEKTVLQSA